MQTCACDANLKISTSFFSLESVYATWRRIYFHTKWECPTSLCIKHHRHRHRHATSTYWIWISTSSNLCALIFKLFIIFHRSCMKWSRHDAVACNRINWNSITANNDCKLHAYCGRFFFHFILMIRYYCRYFMAPHLNWIATQINIIIVIDLHSYMYRT